MNGSLGISDAAEQVQLRDHTFMMMARKAKAEVANLLLPVDALWLDAFRSELKAFPSGHFDDHAYRFSQFVNYQLRNWKWVMTEYVKAGGRGKSAKIGSGLGSGTPGRQLR